MLSLNGVTKAYNGRVVLSDITLRVDPAEFVCLTGPSGAGKTTLLSLLIGAERPSKGTVEIDGVDLRSVPPAALQLFRRRVGVVFQDYKLLPHRTVAENVAFPLEVAGAPDAWIAPHVFETLTRMGLAGLADAYPEHLSGGEKAKVAVARAVVHKPLIVLADEPIGNLDPSQAMEVLALLKDVHADKTTVILTTHDAALAETLKTRTLRLENGVLRDTPAHVGRGHKAIKEAPPPTKHDFFTDDAIPPSSGSRKINITSIHSDGI